MISAIAAALISSTTPVVAEYEFVEVWSRELPAQTRVSLADGYLRIGEASVSPLDGSETQVQEDAYTLDVWPMPDLTKESTSLLYDAPIGYAIFYRGDEYDYAFRGHIREEGHIRAINRLSVLDKNGEVVSEVSSSPLSRPLYVHLPARITPKLEDGYFLIESFPRYKDRDTRYHTILFHDTLEFSRLYVYHFTDLTNPSRALGVRPYPNYIEYFSSILAYVAPTHTIICASIFTGETLWRFSDEYHWAKHTGEYVLAYNGVDNIWGISKDVGRLPHGPGFTVGIIDVSDVGSHELDMLLPEADVSVIEGLVVAVRREVESTKITSYRIVER